MMKNNDSNLYRKMSFKIQTMQHFQLHKWCFTGITNNLSSLSVVDAGTKKDLAKFKGFWIIFIVSYHCEHLSVSSQQICIDSYVKSTSNTQQFDPSVFINGA